MNAINVLSNKIIVEFDEDRGMLVFCMIDSHPPEHRLEISKDTLSSMSFSEASQFLGERLVLLNPHLREIYQDYFWSEDGSAPKKT
jgi:hypothetical protein